jgi:hypothetical protein
VCASHQLPWAWFICIRCAHTRKASPDKPHISVQTPPAWLISSVVVIALGTRIAGYSKLYPDDLRDHRRCPAEFCPWPLSFSLRF